jgi:hypothetical protein
MWFGMTREIAVIAVIARNPKIKSHHVNAEKQIKTIFTTETRRHGDTETRRHGDTEKNKGNLPLIHTDKR